MLAHIAPPLQAADYIISYAFFIHVYQECNNIITLHACERIIDCLSVVIVHRKSAYLEICIGIIVISKLSFVQLSESSIK